MNTDRALLDFARATMKKTVMIEARSEGVAVFACALAGRLGLTEGETSALLKKCTDEALQRYLLKFEENFPRLAAEVEEQRSNDEHPG